MVISRVCSKVIVDFGATAGRWDFFMLLFCVIWWPAHVLTRTTVCLDWSVWFFSRGLCSSLSSLSSSSSSSLVSAAAAAAAVPLRSASVCPFSPHLRGTTQYVRFFL